MENGTQGECMSNGENCFLREVMRQIESDIWINFAWEIYEEANSNKGKKLLVSHSEYFLVIARAHNITENECK